MFARMSPKIVVVGSSNTDIVVQVRELPLPGETVLGADYIQAGGGKGANQAVAAARLGAAVTFVARVGMDAFGRESITAFEAEGIDTQYIVRDGGSPSGVALITVNSSGENTIAVASGSNAKLSPEDVLAAEPAIRAADCLLVQLEIPLETVQAAIQLAARHKVPVILNPAPAKALPASLLKIVDYLTPNEGEAVVLAGRDSSTPVREAALFLQAEFHLRNLIITLGKDGAMISGNEARIVPAPQVTPIDTTGAGDAFNGGLAVALARGDELAEAVWFANVVAALSTLRPGAQPSMPTMEEVRALLDNPVSGQ
jgi:ribokinase